MWIDWKKRTTSKQNFFTELYSNEARVSNIILSLYSPQSFSRDIRNNAIRTSHQLTRWRYRVNKSVYRDAIYSVPTRPSYRHLFVIPFFGFHEYLFYVLYINTNIHFITKCFRNRIWSANEKHTIFSILFCQISNKYDNWLFSKHFSWYTFEDKHVMNKKVIEFVLVE